MPAKVTELSQRIAQLAASFPPPDYPDVDGASDPTLHGGAWTPWRTAPVQKSDDEAAAPKRRSVLLITVDDLRPQLNVSYGVPEVITPHIDELARSGTTFLRAYVQQQVCSPSRNSFMTVRTTATTTATAGPWLECVSERVCALGGRVGGRTARRCGTSSTISYAQSPSLPT